MNEVQINEGVSSLTQREIKFLVQLSMAYECAGKRLSDVTLRVTARMYAKELKINDEQIVDLFLEARKISDIPTLQILSNLCVEKFRERIKYNPPEKISTEELNESRAFFEVLYNKFFNNKKNRGKK
jgi:hypothetical protein